MANLPDDVKAFIVVAFARFRRPVDIKAQVGIQFGLEISYRQIVYYNPSTHAGLGQRWQDLHELARKRFLTELEDVPLAHEAARLSELWNLYLAAMKDSQEIDDGNLSAESYALRNRARDEAAGRLKHAATEASGGFSGVQKHRVVDKEGEDAGPMIYVYGSVPPPEEPTPE